MIFSTLPFFYVAISQFVLILFGIILMILSVIILSRSKRRQKEVEKFLQKLFEEAILTHSSFSLDSVPKKYLKVRSMLKVAESFDKRYKDAHWIEIKVQLAENFLKPATKKWIKSSFWEKRSLLIRSIYLYPTLADKPLIEKMMADSSYFIRMLAAFSAGFLQEVDLTYKLLQKMSQEPYHCHYAYRNAILKGGEKLFDQLLEIYANEKNEEIRSCCLDIFSYRTLPALAPLISKDLDSKNNEIRRNIAKLLVALPSDESVLILQNYLDDPQPSVRAEAAKSLGTLKARSAIDKLSQALSDPVWEVRLNAGLALMQLGREGRLVLESQDWDNDIQAYEMARFLLTT